jgi:uncharacterized repeat protein (TIGR01451 family)
MEPASLVRGMRARALRAVRLALAIGFAVALFAPASATLAQGTLAITTPYPAVSVQPGASASFQITVAVSEARQVDLAVSGVPSGWTGVLHGGGFTIDSVYATKDSPPDVKLDVKVPDSATEGTTSITLTATSGGLSSHLVLKLTVAAQAGGTVSMTSDFPNLKGRSDQAYTFNLQVHNDTPQQLTFTLSATGPDGWTVDAKPASQAQAASFAVDAGSTGGVTVTVTPATDAASDTYPVTVDAVSGSFTAEQKLSVQITGNVTIDLTTPDQRLSTNASAGSGKAFTLVVSNTGTSPAENITVSATPPTGWTVTFDLETIASLQPNTTQNVIATIKPAAEAIAGDYVVSFRAATAESNKSVDVRVTVETSVIWGVVGLAIIALVVAGLVYVFQRYGRR